MDMNTPTVKKCDSVMNKIRELDFSLVEVVLYLDVYPNCKEALDHYHKLLDARNRLVAEYEKHTPLTAFSNTSTESWDWIDSPWPWKYDAN